MCSVAQDRKNQPINHELSWAANCTPRRYLEDVQRTPLPTSFFSLAAPYAASRGICVTLICEWIPNLPRQIDMVERAGVVVVANSMNSRWARFYFQRGLVHEVGEEVGRGQCVGTTRVKYIAVSAHLR